MPLFGASFWNQPADPSGEWVDRCTVRSFHQSVSSAAKGGLSTNLPAEVTTFVGRRRELHTAKELLSAGRLVTLTGMGGVGKTRLARRLAAEVRRAFPDGTWQVELADLHDPTSLPEAIAMSLGLRERSTRWAAHALAEAMGTRHLLLLLDSCEHVLDECAYLVSQLLASCPKLHVLATSRQPLNVAGEQVLPLAPLPVPDCEDVVNPAALERYDAVRLFLDRAIGEVAGFAINERNCRTVAELCQRVEGVPLAIELAANRLRSLSPEQILARLDDRFRVLTRGRRGAPPRQQTLQALIDWSFELCSPVQRALWSYLSIFAGGFELDAAEAVCDAGDLAGEELIDVVADLVDRSVLVRTEQQGVVRYRMGELIREYGLHRLRASGKEQKVEERHRSWCAELARQAYVGWYGPDQLSWYERIRREINNIRIATGAQPAGAAALEQVLEILAHLVSYSVALGDVHRSLRSLRDAVVREGEPTLSRARGLRAAAYLTVMQRNDQTITVMLDESAVIARNLGSEADAAWVTAIAGVAEFNRGNLRVASEHLERAYNIFRELDEQHGAVFSLGRRAAAAALLGDSATAVQLDAELDSLAPGERWLHSYVAWAMGLERWRAGELDAAAELQRASIVMRKPFGDNLAFGMCLEVLALIAADRGKAETAAQLLGSAEHALERDAPSITKGGLLADEHARYVTLLREKLGDEAFEDFVDRGRKLSADEAVTIAGGPPRTNLRTHTAAKDQDSSPLTRREHEIAKLVAVGMTNKEIASALVISQRTAEGHVEHILTKLGFRSRAQVAAWVADRSRTPHAERGALSIGRS